MQQRNRHLKSEEHTGEGDHQCKCLCEHKHQHLSGVRKGASNCTSLRQRIQKKVEGFDLHEIGKRPIQPVDPEEGQGQHRRKAPAGVRAHASARRLPLHQQRDGRYYIDNGVIRPGTMNAIR